MKIKNRHCTSLKEFNKVERKYFKYYIKKNNNRSFNIWLSVDILDEELNSEYFKKYTKKRGGKLKDIRNEVLNNMNKTFTENNKQYFLRGIQITDEDYYCVFISKDNSRLSLSCVGKIYYD